MSRPRKKTREELLDNALMVFWQKGFNGTSMDDLVRTTGVSRGSIYSEYGGKKALFLACMEHYQSLFISLGFIKFEEEDVSLEGVRACFRGMLEQNDDPAFEGIGCLFGNSMTEVGPQDPDIAAIIKGYTERLKKGLAKVIRNETKTSRKLSTKQVDELATYMMVSIQGLWAYSRTKPDEALLYGFIDNLIDMIRDRV